MIEEFSWNPVTSEGLSRGGGANPLSRFVSLSTGLVLSSLHLASHPLAGTVLAYGPTETFQRAVTRWS